MKLLGFTLAVCLGVLPAAAANPYRVPEDLLAEHHRPASTSPPLTLDEIERIALADNPEIHVAARQLAVVEARVPAAGALDDPIFMYRGWGIPFSQPVNYNAAQNMFMLGQTFPWPGKRDLRTAVARSDVGEVKAVPQNTRLQVRIRVRKAFYDLLLTQDELRIHDEHVAIARQAIEAARIKYTVGKPAAGHFESPGGTRQEAAREEIGCPAKARRKGNTSFEPVCRRLWRRHENLPGPS